MFFPSIFQEFDFSTQALHFVCLLWRAVTVCMILLFRFCSLTNFFENFPLFSFASNSLKYVVAEKSCKLREKNMGLRNCSKAQIEFRLLAMYFPKDSAISKPNNILYESEKCFTMKNL